MKVKYWILFSIILVILSACLNQETFHFKGETDNWAVTYSVDVIDDDRENDNITIRYVGSDEPPENIYYSIKTNYGSASGDADLVDGVFEIAGGCSGCAVVKEDETIDASIEWDEESDNFILENK